MAASIPSIRVSRWRMPRRRSITTIEGLASGSAAHPVQTAFIEQDAVQCGFCTPGQVLAAVALLVARPRPIDDASYAHERQPLSVRDLSQDRARDPQRG
jgi:aerobic-type carbon monoxide dehydrogenase small subunit (CoxS/CutS family)